MATNPEQPISLESVPGRVAFTRAMAARNEGDFPGAIRYFTAAIEAAPDNGFFRYWRADALMRLDEFDAAIADYNGALALLPGDRPSLIGRGVAWLWKESWQAARGRHLCHRRPGAARSLTAWAYRARGVARASLGQLGPATSDYQSYLSLAPQAPDRPTIERWIEELNLVMNAGGRPRAGHATPRPEHAIARRPLAPGRCMPARTAQGRGMLRVTRKDAPSAACPAGVIQEGPPGCRVSVVIPALNEAANLPHVLPRIPPWVHEVLLVDGTPPTAQPRWRSASTPRSAWSSRRGGAAPPPQRFRRPGRRDRDAGRGRLSTDPREIGRFVQAVLAGADLVKGSRFLEGGRMTCRSSGAWGTALVALVRIPSALAT